IVGELWPKPRIAGPQLQVVMVDGDRRNNLGEVRPADAGGEAGPREQPLGELVFEMNAGEVIVVARGAPHLVSILGEGAADDLLRRQWPHPRVAQRLFLGRDLLLVSGAVDDRVLE